MFSTSWFFLLKFVHIGMCQNEEPPNSQGFLFKCFISSGFRGGAKFCHTHTLLQNYVPLSSLVPIVSPKSTCLSTQKTETLHANRKMKDHSNQPIHHTSRRNRSLRTKDMLDFLDGKPMTHDVRCRKRCDRCV